MMAKVSFGFILPTYLPGKGHNPLFLDTLHRGLSLISGHFDSFWSIDHIGADDLESFSTLAYLAGQYPQLKFGHTVICQSFRSPALVARMSATLQYLSGGRFVLGIGAGWNEEEYLANGYDFLPAGVRVGQLEEALQIIRALWSGEPATFSGNYYRVAGAVCLPMPEPAPPILVGAFKPRMLRIAAKFADEWNVSSTSARAYARLIADFEHACAEVGRDPAAVRRSWGGGCICAPTQTEALRIFGERHGDDNQSEGEFDFCGTPEKIVEEMRQFIDLGVTSFMLDCGSFPDLSTLELLISEVMPALNGTTVPG